MRHVTRLSGIFTILLIAAVFTTTTATAQELVPAPSEKPSPLAMTYKTLDDGTYIKITYSSPRKKDRTIFGELVPMDRLWRLGANEATELTNTKPFMIGGKKLDPGTYSVFAIPMADKWQVVINSATNQWGAFSYDQEMDVIRFDVPTSTTQDIHEAFSINFNEEGNGIDIMWEQTMVTIPVGTAM